MAIKIIHLKIKIKFLLNKNHNNRGNNEGRPEKS